jgi:hypothetical protein
MTSTSELLLKYQISRSQFYQRRDCLIKLGYDLQGQKVGRNCTYTPEQVELLDRLDKHIKSNWPIDKFPTAALGFGSAGQPPQAKAEQNGNGNGNGHVQGSELVSYQGEQLEITEADEEEIEVDTNPTADIKEQQLNSVDAAAQYSAAELMAIFNYRQLDYMKNRNFTIPGLAEEVHKSEEAVRQSFDSMMGVPGESIKKKLKKLRQRDQRT